MGGPSGEIYVTGGGSSVIATDEMLADVESMAVLAPGLGTIQMMMKIADAYAVESLTLAHVGSSRASLEQAWLQLGETLDLVEYLGPQLERAIADYTEAEENSRRAAQLLDPLVAAILGGYLGDFLDSWQGDLFGRLLPESLYLYFAGDGKAISPDDVEGSALLNALTGDPANIALLRGLLTNGDAFIAGMGGLPDGLDEQLSAMGVTGVERTAALLMLLGGMAGLLTETGVAVTKSAWSDRPGGVTTGFTERVTNIPEPTHREDGAQIRIDTIYDGDEIRYEVFIAGTADFNPIPAGEPFDTTSNVAGVAGQEPASLRAVQLAMEQAGITAASAVTFTGHSQGGLIATLLAASGDYNTQGLVTIGAPAGQVVIPSGFPAVIIENDEDMVPAFGGNQINTEALLVTRQAFDEEHPADPDLPFAAHHIEAYIETTNLMDAAESEALQNAAAELNEFSSADHVVSQWYTAQRTP